MKKEEIAGYLTYLVMIVIVMLVGFLVIQPNVSDIYESLGSSTNIWLFVIISLVIGYILNICLVEVGHVIGAKLGGYNLLSVNIGGLCFYKVYENEKLVNKVGFKSFDGLTGETKIIPSNKKSLTPIYYIIFPFVMLAIEFGALIACWVLISDSSDYAYIKYAMTLVSTVGGLILIYDYIPFKLDTSNDGYKYTLLTKKINVEAFNEMLKIEGDLLLNKDSKNYKIFEEITDYTASLNMLSIYNYLDNNEIDKAIEICDKIINSESKIHSKTRLDAKIWKLFILLKEGNETKIKEFYSSLSEFEIQVFKKDKTLSSLRTLIYYSIKIDKSESFARETKEKYDKLYKGSTSTFKEKDKKLFDEIYKEIDKLKEETVK